MSVVCRLHNSLPSQPVQVVNTTLLLCSTNRVCFDGSTPNLKPYTLHPEPHTLHSESFTLNPKSCTLNPTL